MAKEFKEFDTMFSKKEIEDCRNVYLRKDMTRIKDIRGWLKNLDYWNNAEIREHVYFGKGATEWQLLRVSMKGVTTAEKLHMLENYYYEHDAVNNAAVKCRIDNYIGALKRGGQLDSVTLEILK